MKKKPLKIQVSLSQNCQYIQTNLDKTSVIVVGYTLNSMLIIYMFEVVGDPWSSHILGEAAIVLLRNSLTHRGPATSHGAMFIG